MVTNERQCAHQGCVCPADPGSDYCSAACQQANSSAQTPCPCNHELCQQNQQAARMPAGQRGVSGSFDPKTQKEDAKKPLLDDWGKSDKH